MNSNEIGSYRDTQNANTGNDMALMFESMVHAMKKNSQQVSANHLFLGSWQLVCRSMTKSLLVF